jgi:DNA topoisomerase-1
MSKKLFVLESPGKIAKISKILGPEYEVVASLGTIRDLPEKSMGIDFQDNFKPLYEIMPSKKKTVINLQYKKQQCSEYYLATDDDYEGHAIALSIQEVLNIPNAKRVIFHEITANAINKALSNTTVVDINKSNSQLLRREVDRILGYLVSPILQKYLQAGLSAGRTQSVGVRIIIDKENEVNESIQTIINKPFFKSISEFKYNDIKLEATLVNNKENYKIESKELAIEILNKLDKKNVCKIISADIEETKRHPPPAHTTATIMQEASSKLGMNIKRCNDNLQKLYENGKISYHRTDSTSLSKEYVGMTKEYINKNYGETYYKYREYKNKDESAQNAHEAIRNIYPEDHIEGEGITTDMQRLYKLIFQRATASLMKEALIDVQTVLINILTSSSNNKSILPDNSLYQTKFEEIKFYGFLAIYDNKIEKSQDSEENENKKGLLNIIIDGSNNTIINHINTDMVETFNTPILRHNEAGLIKYLKKSGVGRPSTYSAIISKIIERNYVEIKNIDGIEKDVITLSVSNKKYNSIKEKSKKVKIGAEKSKICPTELGYKTNEFLMKHFNNVINVEFTAGLEEKMDMVAENKAKWFNVVGEFYNMINPIVIKLNTDAPQKSLTDAYSANDKNLGSHNGQMIYLTKSKFGFCVKVMENEKWRYGSIGDTDPKDITLEQAIEFLKYPKDIGKIGSTNVILCKGKFGPYFKIGAKLVGIKDKEINIDNKDDDELLELAKELNSDTNDTKSSLPNNTYMIGKTKVYLKEGDNGPYLMVPHGDGGTRKPTFISIPKGTDRTKLTATKIKEIMDNHKKQKTEGYKSYKGQDSKWKKN